MSARAASAPPGSSGASVAPSPTADHYAINIGDTVSPDHPSAGAGIISKPGEKETYAFSGRAGSIIYVKVGPCDGAAPAFDLRDPANNLVDGNLGCGDFGPVTLRNSGTYRIVASAEKGAAHYTFSLRPTTVDQYSIKIGDTVSPDHPSTGAGIIGQAGERQSYSFAARAGTIVYFKVGPCEGGPVSFDFLNPANNNIGGVYSCGDFGPVTLSSAGTYRLLAKADRGSSARYTVSLLATRFDQYSIKIGDTVSPDHPSPGAGVITELGQRQAYSFQGRAGDVVYLGLGPCEGASPSFDLLRPDGSVLEAQLATCHVDIGRQTLPVPGTYRIVASTDKAAVASRYGFYLLAVPPDEHFAVHLPLTVSPDVPARSAGHIRAKGAQQSFDFTANPGTVVHIESKCSCPNLAVRAASVGDNGRFGWFDLVNLKNDWKLPAGGSYAIQVRSNGYVGNYSFTASQSDPQRH